MPQTKPFVHLHLHTEFSLLDGACRIDGLMQRVKELGQTAVAITDHGSMFGCVDFFVAAKEAGVKPIIGCEVYLANRKLTDKTSNIDGNSHLVLLCKNETGYQNLIKMVSLGYTEGFYSKPRIDKDLLEKYHDGLICLSACLAGEIPRALLAGNYQKAKETALWFDNLFGRDNFYIEIQDHGLEEQQKVLPGLLRLAKDTEIPLVATNDAHYLRKDDAKVQSILVCIQTGKTVNDDDKLEFGTEEFYVKGSSEMRELFSIAPEACSNTAKIAEMCDFSFQFGNTKLPEFTAPEGQTNKEYFLGICEKGFKKYYGETPNTEAVERLQYEISVIENMGYINYYLIVADFISFARSKGIPVGPGRGSGAGSIVAYCMGITGVDPIKYNLLFERFLNPERISMPDFDIDFCYERRQEVIDYVIDKYGKDHVAQIITFGTMAARAAIRDVGRVLDVPYQKVDTIAKMVPMEVKMTLDRALKVSKDLRKEYDSDPVVKELIDVSMKLEGMPRHASTHAAGVVITPKATSEYVPLSTNEGAVVTQFPMGTIENLGLLKMDFLGLRTLTVISDTEKMLKKATAEFDIEKIPFDDEATYQLLSSGYTDGVFQLESGGMKNTLIGLKPENLEDIIALISLYRPGPMDSIPTYIRNRHNPSLVRYKTEKLAAILDVTYGCIVYQEQVMQICRELAGYSYGQADIVRRAMSKKKHDVMEKEREKFVHGSDIAGEACMGCVKNGIPVNIANEIFDDMSSFASYAFNKSHAAAYAVVAYQTAYLKCHHPKEFMAALLTSVLGNTDKIIAYISECHRLDIRVLPPDINKSSLSFAVQDGAIRYGLFALKNVGSNLIKTLVQKREADGEFTSLYDFCSRMSGSEINRRAVESFIKSGCFDKTGDKRHAMIEALESILKSIETTKRKNIEGQLDFFGMADGEEENGGSVYKMPDLPEYSKELMLQQEKEVSGLFLSGHPLEQYRNLAKDFSVNTVAELLEEENAARDGVYVRLLCIINKIKFFVTKGGDNMAFVSAEDLTGIIEIVVFPRVLEESINAIKENSAIYIKGKTSVKEEEDPKILADSIVQASELEKEKPNKTDSGGLYLRLPSHKDKSYLKAVEIIKQNGGNWPVYARFEDSNKMVVLPDTIRAKKGNEALLGELRELLGDNNVASR